MSKIESMKTFERVYDLVSKIPKGKITTYGTLAKLVGTSPKVIGYALSGNKDPENIPCHRVINSKGKISGGYAFGGPDMQKQMLEKEKIKFDKETVDLNIFGFLIT